MVSVRQQRLNQLMRDEISNLMQHETDDPLLASVITITEVEGAQDPQGAKVYVSFMEEGAEADELMKLLRKAAGYFRRGVAERLNLRHTPELEFIYDPSIARGARVLALLREISASTPAEPEATPATPDA